LHWWQPNRRFVGAARRCAAAFGLDSVQDKPATGGFVPQCRVKQLPALFYEMQKTGVQARGELRQFCT